MYQSKAKRPISEPKKASSHDPFVILGGRAVSCCSVACILSGSLTLLIAVTVTAVVVMALSIADSVFLFRHLENRKRRLPFRIAFTVAAISSLTFSISLGCRIPVAWRASDANLKALSSKFNRAGNLGLADARHISDRHRDGATGQKETT